MPGFTYTRGAIETEVADVINRSDMTTQIQLCFERAYRSIQRLRDWKAQENTIRVTLATNTDDYVLTGFTSPNINLKKPAIAYIWDPTANLGVGGATRFFEQTTIEAIRVKRVESLLGIEENGQFIGNIVPITSKSIGDDVTVYYAIWQNTLSVWPSVDTNWNNLQFRLDGWFYLDPPAAGDTTVTIDYFIINGRDYLLYASLLEWAAYNPADPRIQLWTGFRDKATRELLGVDIDATWAGPLVMRG